MVGPDGTAKRNIVRKGRDPVRVRKGGEEGWEGGSEGRRMKGEREEYVSFPYLSIRLSLFCFISSTTDSPSLPPSLNPSLLPSSPSPLHKQEKKQGGGHKGHWAATDDGTLTVTKGSLDRDDPNYDSAVRLGGREGGREGRKGDDLLSCVATG